LITTIEQLVQREVQERLDDQVKVFRLPFRLRVVGLRTENATYVLDVQPSRDATKDDPRLDAARQVTMTLLSYVGMKMEEDHPGLRVLLLPEFERTHSSSKSGRARKNRTASKGKGR
jgi:hypothetical protein